jgi:phospholipid/cholesterol/gamma-HCH transport system substrate-binding protein
LKKKSSSIFGILITVILIVGGVWLFANRDKLKDDKHYHIYFNDVEGLTIASQVSINGAMVGRVSDVQLMPPNSVKVIVAVGKDVLVPKGTTAKISSAGMSGGQEIRLIPGQGKEMIPDEGIITGENAISLYGQNGKIGATLDVARVTLRTADSIITDLSDLFNTATKQDIRFQLNKLNLESNKASRRAVKARGTGERFAGQIASINEDVANMAESSKEWPQDIAKIDKQTADMVASTANIEQDLKDLQTNLKKIKSIADKAKDTSNPLGKLLNDPQQVHTATKEADTLNRALKDVMEYPAAHWFSIFGKNKKKED